MILESMVSLSYTAPSEFLPGQFERPGPPLRKPRGDDRNAPPAYNRQWNRLVRCGSKPPASKAMSSVYLDRYTAFMLRHRWLVLASAVAVMVVLTAGLQFITASNDWRDSFDEHNPQLVAFDNLEDTYSVTHAALIAVAPKGGSVFTREALGAVEELTEAAWRVPWSTRVDSLTNYYHSEAVEDDLNVERLVDDAGSLSDDDLARIERIALNEISVAGRLVSYDGRVAGLAISFALPENSNAAVTQITDYVRGLLDEARADHPDIAYHLTGDVFVSRVMTEAFEDDMRILRRPHSSSSCAPPPSSCAPCSPRWPSSSCSSPSSARPWASSAGQTWCSTPPTPAFRLSS